MEDFEEFENLCSRSFFKSFARSFSILNHGHPLYQSHLKFSFSLEFSSVRIFIFFSSFEVVGKEKKDCSYINTTL